MSWGGGAVEQGMVQKVLQTGKLSPGHIGAGAEKWGYYLSAELESSCLPTPYSHHCLPAALFVGQRIFLLDLSPQEHSVSGGCFLPSCQETPRQGPSGDGPQLWDLREASGLAVRLPQFLGAPLSPSTDGHSFPGSPDCLIPGLKNPELRVGEVNWKQENIPSRASWLALSLSLSLS